jgi:pimeloyl-ACP methyl ester carboxylesterase
VFVFFRTLAYFIIAVTVAGLIAAVLLAHPISAPVTDADLHAAEQLGIVKDLNLPPLSGWLIMHNGGARPTMVFIHGRSSNRMQMFPLAKAFFDRGFNAVLWDLRHHGNSRGDETYGKQEVPDVLRVVDHIRNEPAVDPKRIDLLGFSLGAGMSIGAASADPGCAIHAIVADSPYANLRDTGFWYVRLFGRVPESIAWPVAFITLNFGAWMSDLDTRRLNPSDWAASVRVPVLLIQGEKDRRVNPDSSSRIFAKLGSKKDLWVVPGAGHTEAFYKNPQTYVDRVTTFFADSVRAGCVPASRTGILGT